jgi:hypothetical protein
VDNHPNLYSLTTISTQALRDLVRNQSPLHHQSKKKGFPEGVALFFRLLEVEVGIESASGTGCVYFPIGK